MIQRLHAVILHQHQLLLQPAPPGSGSGAAGAGVDLKPMLEEYEARKQEMLALNNRVIASLEAYKARVSLGVSDPLAKYYWIGIVVGVTAAQYVFQ